MTSPFSSAGAWELVSDTKVGLALFTDTHFTMTAVAKDRPRYPSDDLSDAEAAAAFRALETAGGTYEVTGDKIIFHRMVNRHPNWAGQDYTWGFRLEGDELQLNTMSWRRVG
jgi:hypothetical protein